MPMIDLTLPQGALAEDAKGRLVEELTAALLKWEGAPDTAFFRALHSTKGQNWNSWSVPELDALLEDGRRTMDGKKRKEIYDKVQLMILENVPHLWLFSADTIDFTQATVKGFRQHPTTLLYGLEGVSIG